MSLQPFEASWHRLDRANEHRKAAADAWNTWLEDEPYDFVLHDDGDGHFTMRVVQELPTPPEMAVYLGEWFYNLRCALDYAVYDTAAFVSRRDPPPGEGVLQCPVYFSEAEYRKNEYRLKPLADQHRAILELMQPYGHDDPDTSALGWLHKLARIDRHRRLHVMTAYAAEMAPLVNVPEGCTFDLDISERIVVDYEAEIAHLTVTPWEAGWKVEVNPQTGLDPEIAEWAASDFWRRIPYNERLRMLHVVARTIVIPLEYDCLGYSRESDFLTDDFRAECDARRQERERTGRW